MENQKEQTAVVSAPDGEKNGSTSFGKFRTGDELLQAYNSLEAEFTRRSQKIKELEGKLGNTQESEKWNSRVSELKKRFPAAEGLDGEIADYVGVHKELLGSDDCLEKALLGVLAERYSQTTTAAQNNGKGTDGQNAYKNKIIAEYLEGVSKSAPPSVETGGEIPVVLPQRPSTVREAGKVALEILKKINK